MICENSFHETPWFFNLIELCGPRNLKNLKLDAVSSIIAGVSIFMGKSNSRIVGQKLRRSIRTLVLPRLPKLPFYLCSKQIPLSTVYPAFRLLTEQYSTAFLIPIWNCRVTLEVE